MSVINEELANEELEKIEEFFEVEYSDDDKKKIIPAIQDGRIVIDNERLNYSLIKPFEQKNGVRKEVISLKTASCSDIERMNRGFTVTVNKNEETVMDLSKIQIRSMKSISILSGEASGIIDRIGRKDMRVLSSLLSFFD